mmetsp:Transcript_13956/g.50131  ORF Transcript_13956/g.50131 Transcript_13956/m.50131 type:complete len:228 (-) Transcript_13956:688-1371(-)
MRWKSICNASRGGIVTAPPASARTLASSHSFLCSCFTRFKYAASLGGFRSNSARSSSVALRTASKSAFSFTTLAASTTAASSRASSALCLTSTGVRCSFTLWPSSWLRLSTARQMMPALNLAASSSSTDSDSGAGAARPRGADASGTRRAGVARPRGAGVARPRGADAARPPGADVPGTRPALAGIARDAPVAWSSKPKRSMGFVVRLGRVTGFTAGASSLCASDER